MIRSRTCALLLCFTTVAVDPAIGHETDQYTLPLGRQLADLRDYFSVEVHADLVAAVAAVNAEIDTALAQRATPTELAELQSGDHIAARVWANLFATFTTVEGLDLRLHGAGFAARYPGRLAAYRPEHGIYDAPGLVLDPTKFVRTFFRASTIQLDGHLIGTDKLIHFIYLGSPYHRQYRAARARGLSPNEAAAEAVEHTSGRNPFRSEDALLGMFTTGIRSNADLAADYAGLLFLRNLYEPVPLRSGIVPPLLERDGPYWRVRADVQPYSDFFVRFVTPHWNEALNPNVYASYTAGRIREALTARCRDLIDWYRDPQGRRRDQGQFAALQQSLSTHYGAPYGWADTEEQRLDIARLCFESETSSDAGAAIPAARTRLHTAVIEHAIDDVHRLLARGEDPDHRDADGETPLHTAVRLGAIDIARLLLNNGAQPDSRDRYDSTPLHLAAQYQRLELLGMLLAAGADANARDIFGRTALHEVAGRRAHELARSLLAHGARADIASGDGLTPLDLAAAADDPTVSSLLSAQSSETRQ